MKKLYKTALFILSGSSLMGCQFSARSADDYQKETAELLAGRQTQLKTCYDVALIKDKQATGVVAVNFSIAPETGAIENPQVDTEKSTASGPLQKCVLDALDGLALTPPDQREGVASFTYEFTANAPKQG